MLILHPLYLIIKFKLNQIQIGLNDDDKIQYKIEAEEPAQINNNRLTVAWESGNIFLWTIIST
jgi:hypothetical protein